MSGSSASSPIEPSGPRRSKWLRAALEALVVVVAQHALDAPVIVDPSGAIARTYGVSAYPTTFFVDASGLIRHVEVGYTTELGMRLRLWSAGL